MHKWIIDRNTLSFAGEYQIRDALNLQNLLAKHADVITKIRINAPVDISVIFLLKKYLSDKTEVIEMPSKYKEIWSTLSTTLPESKAEATEYSAVSIIKGLSLFDMTGNTKPQDNFWVKIFLKTFKVLTIDNIAIISFLFIGVGMAIQLISYMEFESYGLALDSCKLVVYSGVKVLCPMLVNIIITAKSCTALTAVIKTMNTNLEFKIMDLVNLPHNRVYLHPIFIACALAGPIMNLLALFALNLGAVTAWSIKGNSPYLYMGIVQAEANIIYIIESELRAFLCSICLGFATCLSGMLSGDSFDSTIKAINLCVSMSFISNIAIQALISLIHFTPLHI